MKHLIQEKHLDILKLMLMIREGDRREALLSRQGKGGELLTCKGHEALTAITLQLNKEDFLFPYYRGYHLIMGKGISREAIARDFLAKKLSSSGGRCAGPHCSSVDLSVFPNAGPTASQCLPAVGLAWGQKILNNGTITVCSIGDGSTREGEFYEAICFAVEKKLPILFVIEDNGYAISTKTEQMFPFKMNIFASTLFTKIRGYDVEEVWSKSEKIIDQLRKGEGPAILWCELDRLGSHSIHDEQMLYRSEEEMNNLKDPIALYTEKLIAQKVLDKEQYKEMCIEVEKNIQEIYDNVQNEEEPEFENIKTHLYGEVITPPPLNFSSHQKKSTIREDINKVFSLGLEQNPSIIMFGQDIEDPKGGIFGFTKGLSTKFPGRVVNAPIAESNIIGSAMGLAIKGFKPVFEIQFVDYLVSGFNQLVNQIPHFRWRTCGKWKCPMILYSPYGATDTGDGLWHSQSNDCWWAHSPGLKVAIPSTPADVVGLFWTAFYQDDPCLILIPKNVTNLRVATTVYEPIPFGKANIRKTGNDITLVTWGNCVCLSEQAADIVAEHGISVEVIDLRTLVPYDKDTLNDSILKTKKLLVVQEDNRTCGFGASIISNVIETLEVFRQLTAAPKLVAREDMYIPYHSEWKKDVMVGTESITSAIYSLVEHSHKIELKSEKKQDEQELKEIRVPQMGKGLSEVNIISLYKNVGDLVKKDEFLYQMETEKSTLDIESPYEGILNEWLVTENSIVGVGDVVAKIKSANSKLRNKDNSELKNKDNIINKDIEIKDIETDKVEKKENVSKNSPIKIIENEDAEVKALSQQQQILNLRFRQSQKVVIPATVVNAIQIDGLASAAEYMIDQQKEPMPLVTEFQVFAYAVSQIVPKFPKFRSLLLNDKTVKEYRNLNLGIAVSSAEDLYVAVLEKANTLSFYDFIQEFHSQINPSLNGEKQKPTPSNIPLVLSYMGNSGIISGAPLLVAPTVAIIAFGSTYEEKDKKFVKLSLTFDHRLINGLDASNFLQEIGNKVKQLSQLCQNQTEKPATIVKYSSPSDIENNYEDKRKLQTFLTQEIAELVQTDAANISTTKPLGLQGVDSLTALKIINLLETRFNQKFPATFIWRYPTIEHLTNHLISNNVQTNHLVNIETKSHLEIIPPQSPRNDTPIAIIGVGLRFPGNVNNLDGYWDLLKNSRDAISSVPISRWKNQDRQYYGGFIENIDEFAANFFHISPLEANFIDPQQRIFLEVAWQAIEDAGYSPESLKGTKTGVYTGVSNHDYLEVIENSGIRGPLSAIGISPSLLSNRLSYLLDLRGASQTIDTACSSSLVALHLAINAINTGDCDQAIVGSSNLLLTSHFFDSFFKAGMLSPDGRCKTFDKDANGYVRGEGVAVILVKPLDKAENDGDHIYGVIRASAVNHGGKANSLTAPNLLAQKELLETVYAKIPKETISYIEAHGTGTPLGDPIEVDALKEALDEKIVRCGLGSVKSNFGHLEATSGLAGLLKVLLCLKHKKLVPTLHFNELNPHIDLENSNFYICRDFQDWSIPAEIPLRRAGVSSFGFGGTNAHVVLEEYLSSISHFEVETKEPVIIPVSAKTKEELKQRAKDLLEFLCSYSDVDLLSIAYTLQVGREAMEERLGFTVNSIRKLKQKLERFISDNLNTKDLYIGQRKQNKDILEMFAFDGELNKTIEKWIAQKKFSNIIDLWVKGLEFDWNKLYKISRPKRISLPTYPFTKWKYWISQTSSHSDSKFVDSKKNSWLRYEKSVDILSEWKKMFISNGHKIYTSKPKRISLPTSIFNNKKFWVENIYKNQDSTIKNNLLSSEDNPLEERKNSLFALSEVKDSTNFAKSVPKKSITVSLSNIESPTTISEKHKKISVLKEKDTLEDLKSAVKSDMKGVVPTLNRTGVMVEELIPYSKEFADYAGMCKGAVLDIGCAYGVATIAALEKGAEVLAVDMEKQHLDILESRVTSSAKSRLQTLQGTLPQIKFEKERFSAIHASRVLHFLTPTDVQQTINLMYEWLKPGGKLFLVTDTPYFGYWKEKAFEYEKRKMNGDLWPGYIENVHKYFDAKEVVGAPSLINPLDPDILTRECTSVGFKVEKVGFFGSQLNSPQEHVGIIAIKSGEKQSSEDVRDGIKELLSEILRLDIGEIKDETPFSDMGLDSIGAVTWLRKINTKYQLTIPATKIYDYPNIVDFAHFVEKSLEKSKNHIPFPSSTKQTLTQNKVVAKNSEDIREEIKELLSEILRLDIGEIEDETPFSDMGLDSIGAVTWLRKINTKYQLTIPATKIYDYPNIVDFAHFVEKSLEKSKNHISFPSSTKQVLTQNKVITKNSEDIRAGIKELLSEILQLDMEEMEDETPFSDMGLDLVLSTELTQKINTRYQISISAEKIYHYSNISELAVFLQDEMHKASKQNVFIDSKSNYGLVIAQHCDLDNLSLHKFELPAVKSNEITIDIKASAINFGDILHIKGLYPQKPKYPFIIGSEIAGIVCKVGTQVSNISVGDEVIALTEFGGHATQINVPQINVVKKPKNISFEDACSLPIAFWTVYHAFKTAKVKPEESILIQKATEAYGLIAIQLANLYNSFCYTTSDHSEKIEFLKKLKIPYILDERICEFDREINRLTKNSGVDIVLNALYTPNKNNTQRGLRCLNPYGCYLELATHTLEENQESLSLSPSQFFHSIDLGNWYKINPLDDSQIFLGKEVFNLMVSWLESGKLVPITSRIYPFQKIVDALQYVAKREYVGKVVVSHNYKEIVDCTDNLKRVLLQQKAKNEIGQKSKVSFVSDTENSSKKKTQEIAIVGMSGQFPKAKNLDLFWENIIDGKNCISEIPENRWAISRYYDEKPGVPGKTYSKWMGVLEDVDLFDPLFFNISPKQAELMDPQHRLFLQSCWNCIEDAGYNPLSLSGSKCGVFVGCSQSDYLQDFNKHSMNAQSLQGRDEAVLTGQVSYFFNLTGPCLAINTACSSSLVAMANACDSLINNNCKLALAGGVFLMSGPTVHIGMSQTRTLSPRGRCFTFDQEADGFVPGEGVGVVLLKKLEDAIKDRDHIYGVVRGWGVNQDGKSNGLTAPNCKSQVSLQEEIYEKFSIDPSEIQLVEAHGTGTKLGDPIEVEALCTSFGRFTQKENYCALGSVKSNIGHLGFAAGIAGVLKSLLALKYRKLPPTIHFNQLNEHIVLEKSPFYINTNCKDWDVPEGQKRQVAISSFGYSGTNAHIVIREYTPNDLTKTHSINMADNYMIVLSATSKKCIMEYSEKLLEFTKKCNKDKYSDINLVDLAYTLQIGRKEMEERLGFLVSSMKELEEKLQDFVSGKKNTKGIFQGKNTDSFSDFTKDGELIKVVDTWLKEKKYDKILSCWVKGLTLNWEEFYGKAKPKRVSLPTYPFTKQRYWVATSQDQNAAQDKFSRENDKKSNNQGIMLLKPCWQQQTITTEQNKVSYQKHLLILCEPPRSYVDSIRTTIGKIELIILESEETCMERFNSYSIKIFTKIQDILREKSQGNTFVQILVPDIGDGILFSALTGLLKTARLENPKIMGQSILIDSWENAPNMEEIKANGVFPDDQVSYRGNKRRVVSWNKLDMFQRDEKIPWKKNGVYLITGGMGGLGTILASEIVRRIRDEVTIVLVGRTSLDDNRLSLIKEWTKQGANVQYERIDISDRDAVFSLIHNVKKNYGCIDGIIHSAGVVKDNFIIKKDENEFKEVLSPKVSGLINLDLATRNLKLDFFILFSSIAGVTGNVGQSDYSTANSFMDFYATYRNRLAISKKCYGKTLSMNWPFWKDGAMRVNEKIEKVVLQRLNMTAMETQKGLSALYQSLALQHDQIMVMTGNVNEIKFLSKNTLCSTKQPPVELDFGLLKDKVLHQVKVLFAEAIKLDHAQINAKEPLEIYGIDSIVITELNEKLAGIFGQVSKTLFFEYQNLEELADYLIREYPQQCQAWGSNSDINEKHNEKVLQTTTLEINEQSLSNDVNQKEDSIAIIGISGRYPQAPDIKQYWENLQNAKDCIVEIPEDRWELEDFFIPDQKLASKKGKSYSKWGGFIDGFAHFDPLFFNISPQEAMNMDPQERLFIEECWKVFEDAGYTRQEIKTKYNRKVGVFAGITKTGFNLYGPELHKQGKQIYPYTSFGSVANRVSYLLDLQGPSIPVDTMCSSSLTAIHEACQYLQRRECEMAIAGGVNLYLHPSSYIGLCNKNMLSTDGQCKSFGEGGNGFVPGEGVGVVLLKHLSKAIADRDHIYAIIRATSINHGGKTNGYTVPNPNAQRELIEEALKKARINAREISYIEAHGTGTALGDPIEITGLTQAFKKYTNDEGFCAIGSAKSNIGHLEAAAGIAGLTKVILQMQKQKIVPSLHSTKLNPNIDFSKTPFMVQQELREWQQPTIKIDGKEKKYPRRAGISSFGAGGSNAHVILEEYVVKDEIVIYNNEPAIIIFSAKSLNSLKAYVEQFYEMIHKNSFQENDLANIAYTLQVGREAMEERLALVAKSFEDLKIKLLDFLKHQDNEDVFRGKVRKEKSAEKVSIEEWIENKEYRRILSLWVDGLDVDWNKIYSENKPRRISLPTYVFDREQYWLPIEIHPKKNWKLRKLPVEFNWNELIKKLAATKILHLSFDEKSMANFKTSFTQLRDIAELDHEKASLYQHILVEENQIEEKVVSFCQGSICNNYIVYCHIPINQKQKNKYITTLLKNLEEKLSAQSYVYIYWGGNSSKSSEEIASTTYAFQESYISLKFLSFKKESICVEEHKQLFLQMFYDLDNQNKENTFIKYQGKNRYERSLYLQELTSDEIIIEESVLRDKHQSSKSIKDIVVQTFCEKVQLDINKIDINNNFINYGMDSVLALSFTESLSELLHINIDITWLVDYQVISEFIKKIKETIKQQSNKTVEKENTHLKENLALAHENCIRSLSSMELDYENIIMFENNVKFELYIIGKGKPILMIPGIDNQGSIFGSIIKQLVEKKMSVILYHYPGLGRSEMVEEANLMTTIINQIKYFLNQKYTSPIHLFGWSFGAMMAMKVALAHPELFATLTLSNPFYTKKTDFYVKQVKDFDTERNLLEKDLEQNQIPSNKLQGEQSLFMKSLSKNGLAMLLYISQAKQSVQFTLTKEEIEKILLPTLIMTGKHDLGDDHQQSLDLQKWLLNNKLIIFKKSGHFPFFTEKEKFIKQFSNHIQKYF